MAMNVETNKLNGFSKDIKTDVKDMVHRAGSEIESFSQTAGTKAGELAADFRNLSANYLKKGREYVEDNPGKSVAYAAATGLAVGAILSIALRRKRH